MKKTETYNGKPFDLEAARAELDSRVALFLVSNQGISQGRAAKLFGTTGGVIQYISRKAGLRRARGTKGRVFSTAELGRFAELWAAGAKYPRIMAELGIHYRHTVVRLRKKCGLPARRGAK